LYLLQNTRLIVVSTDESKSVIFARI